MAITAPLAKRLRLLTAFLLALSAGLVGVGNRPAHAAPSNVQMPFPCGETWHASTYGGHSPSTNSVDWNLIGVEDHHKPVLAGASGTATVQPFQSGGYGNYVDVSIGGGWVLRYAHLEVVSVGTGQSVTPQTQIGTVGASGVGGSPAPYHLHYEQRLNGVVQPANFNGNAINYVYSYNTPNPYTSANCASGAWNGVGGSASFFGSDTLAAGQQLNSNQYLLSADARFALHLQTDGNLVLYSGLAIWQSSTFGSGATRLVTQTDGNLVLYNGNTPKWSSGTSGTGQAHLTVQADGNVVTYNNSNGSPTWWTGTSGTPGTTYFGSDTLAAGQQLNASQQQHLRSSDKRYGLLLQSDGNLVLYGPGYHVLWRSGTEGSGATRLVMQTDGNLVLYNVNTALWSTSTSGTTASHLTLQSDGNLVIYRDADGAVRWQSGTNGQI